MAPELPRSNAPTAPPPGPFGSDAVVVVNHTEGTLSRRFFAYLIDFVMIMLFSALLCLAIAIIGLLTFGLGWSLFAIVPASAIIYNAMVPSGTMLEFVGARS